MLLASSQCPKFLASQPASPAMPIRPRRAEVLSSSGPPGRIFPKTHPPHSGDGTPLHLILLLAHLRAVLVLGTHTSCLLDLSVS